MNEANIQGLLTASAARNFQKQLTRDEFCEIVVEMVERIRGNPLPLPNANPFTDTNSVHILKAFQYGITNGTTPTTFSPNDNVQRQQICAMMIRAIQGLEQELRRALLSEPAPTLPFSDASRISDYAILPIRYAYTNGIIRGDDLNRVNPSDPITSQECVAVGIRSFKRMETVLAPYRTTEQNLDITEERLTIGYAYGDSEHGVTKNIVLPISGSGGADIEWTSSNPAVINVGAILYADDNVTPIGRVGTVTVGSSAQSVTLTAVISIAGSSLTRTQAFTLRTSTLSGDQLLIENAYSVLDIIYLTGGDSAGSVTGRIGLPDKVLDLPVTWSSSNTDVVTNTGIVHTPSGAETRYVTLTATITNGSQTRTKTFSLTVVNAVFNRSVSLNGVELGATSARVTQVLGAAAKTIQVSNTESWQLYYSGSYSNFIAVAFVSNRAVAVFSMASNAANQLRNSAGTVITVEQANAVSGVNAISYADAVQQYAIMVYESNSAIGSLRTLTADRQEELLFELVNAYRVRNGRAALEWAEKLRAPARAHSAWNVGSAPNVGTGMNALTARADAAEFTTTGGFPLYGGGNILAGQNDAFGFLREMASTAAMRVELLSTSATLFGAGFVSATSGTYRTYMTYMLGNVRFITNVTASPVSGTPATVRVSGAGATVNVTLTPVYTSLISGTNYNETFTVTSSNVNRFTVDYTAGSAACVVTGVTTGDANLVVTGNLSGKVYNIPVNVGAVYATALQVTYPNTIPATTLTNSTSSQTSNQTSNITVVVGVGEELHLTAYATPATANTTPAVVWTQSNVNVTNVSSDANGVNHRFTPTSAGLATVTATVPTSTGANIVHTIYVRVLAAPTFTQSPLTVNTGDSVTLTAGFDNLTGVTPTFTWSSSNSGVLSRAALATETNSAIFNAVGAGTATVGFVAEWRPSQTSTSSTNQYVGRVTGQHNVTVTAAVPPYADSLALSQTGTIYLVTGATSTITASSTPPVVQNSTVTWSSDDPFESVVTFVDGVLTAVGPGSTTITATMASATDPTGIKASVQVVVVDKIEINGSNNYSLVDPGFMNHNLNPVPEGLTVSWESSNPEVATINSGILDLHSAGTATITVTVTYGSWIVLTSDSITITVT